jgi:chromosome segregation ATPase
VTADEFNATMGSLESGSLQITKENVSSLTQLCSEFECLSIYGKILAFRAAREEEQEQKVSALEQKVETIEQKLTRKEHTFAAIEEKITFLEQAQKNEIETMEERTAEIASLKGQLMECMEARFADR